MDVREAFAAMLEELGSSIAELEGLGVSFHPRSDAKVDLFYTITNDFEPASQVEKRPDGSWEAKMLFDVFSLDFADPSSLENLKLFVERAKKQEMPKTDKMWESTITTWPPKEVEG